MWCIRPPSPIDGPVGPLISAQHRNIPECAPIAEKGSKANDVWVSVEGCACMGEGVAGRRHGGAQEARLVLSPP